jgi:Tol biopolymer transport system component
VGSRLLAGAAIVSLVGCHEEAITDPPILPPPLVGELALTISTAGRRPDPDGYRLVIDSAAVRRVSANDEVRIPNLALGRHTVLLDDLASNCHIPQDNPRTVYISNGVSTLVTIAVHCPAPGGITISTSSQGSDPDADGYLVAAVPGLPTLATLNVTDDRWAPMAPEGELSLPAVRPDNYAILLRGLATNCSVTAGKTKYLVVEEEQNVRVDFQVLCQPRQPVPSGEWLAVASHDRRGQWDDDVHLIRTDGTGRRPLTDHPGWESSPEFAPDGQRVAFYRRFHRVSQVVILELATGRETPLPRRAEGSKLAWSPDGTRIAFERDGAIYIAPAAGTGEDYVAPGQGPYWSPDGSRIAFTRWDSPEGPTAYLIAVDRSGQTLLGDGAAGPWSPDGSRLLVTRFAPGGDPYPCYYYYSCYAGAHPDLFIIDVETGGVQQLTNTPDAEWAPVWAPDGQRVFFLSGGYGGGDIFVTRLNSHPVNLTNSGENESWISLGVIGGAASRLADLGRARP